MIYVFKLYRARDVARVWIFIEKVLTKELAWVQHKNLIWNNPYGAYSQSSSLFTYTVTARSGNLPEFMWVSRSEHVEKDPSVLWACAQREPNTGLRFFWTAQLLKLSWRKTTIDKIHSPNGNKFLESKPDSWPLQTGDASVCVTELPVVQLPRKNG